MKIKQYDTKGTEITEIELDPSFVEEINEALLSQYMQVHRKRKALGTKKTKSRGEIRGGGRKPWPQKGTGRARQGSIRAPHWVGGGHAHRILPQMNRRVDLNSKMRAATVKHALAPLLQSQQVFSLSGLELKKPQTKQIVALLTTLNLTNTKTLFVDKERNGVLLKSVNNIPHANATDVSVLSPVEIMKHDAVVFIEGSLDMLQGGSHE